MPPVSVRELVLNNIQSNDVMVFSKTTCPFCNQVKELFKQEGIVYKSLELDKLDNGQQVQDMLFEMSGQKTVPNVFIRGQHVGGCDSTLQAHTEGRLRQLLSPPPAEGYDYDLIVIGGGSGGLSASKEAAKLGKKVAVCDFVKPTPLGTTWGLGGTCVNVGCIPKKLMHQAALLGEALKDSKNYGWQTPEKVEHNWETLKSAVQDHIGSLNWNYRTQLRDKNVKYINGYAEFVDRHTVKTVNKRNKVQFLKAEKVLLAMGMRPRYPDIPGVKEFAITSDDLFSLSYCPGKTLTIGASYVSLECAGFLTGMGLDVTVMVRSILLRGFDQQMAEMIGTYMEKHGTHFLRKCVPTRIEKLEEGTPPLLRVFYKKTDDPQEFSIDVNTVLMAIGRDACTSEIGLEKTGVITNPKNGKIPVVNEQTNVPNIYAIGDIIEGGHELTPVAIEAGKLLSRRLYSDSTRQCDYINVPTTVFTPLEYGAIGYSEEDATDVFGADNIEVYHSYFQPLEYTVAHRDDAGCYGKVICNKADGERVIGFHVLGPNAGEVTQGYAVAMKCGATKEHFDTTIGIHPTCSEVFTTMDVTKSSGLDVTTSGC